MAKSAKLARWFKIVTLIEGRGNLKASDLARECEVSERTIYRDIDELSIAGIPVFFDGCGYRITENFFLPPLTLNLEEALGVVMGADALAEHKGTPFAKAVTSAREKITAVLPESCRDLLTDAEPHFDLELSSLVDYEDLGHIFEIIQQATHGRNTIKITYLSMSANRVGERCVDPYAMMFRGQVWYLVGYCHWRGEVKIFRIDRIKEIALTDGTYAVPKDFSLDEYMADSWQVNRGNPVKVKIKFKPDAARWVKEFNYHPSQKILENPDGSIIFAVTVGGLSEIKRWALGFGSDCEVLSPPELVREMKEIALGMNGIYK